MKDDGKMARVPDLILFAREHKLKLGSIADLIRYRTESEKLVELKGTRQVENATGRFDLRTYKDRFGGVHLAMVVGEWSDEEPVMVRVHEPLSIVDFLDDNANAHSWPLSAAQSAIQAEGKGVVLLLNVVEAEQSLIAAAIGQSEEAPASAAPKADSDLRTYGVGAQILRSLGVRKMRVLGNARRFPSIGGFELHAEGFLHYEP
jgi:3,4-dihydroxy 2-butanone 4-phosphate synthase/GTP cyclohydrolase II